MNKKKKRIKYIDKDLYLLGFFPDNEHEIGIVEINNNLRLDCFLIELNYDRTTIISLTLASKVISTRGNSNTASFITGLRFSQESSTFFFPKGKIPNMFFCWDSGLFFDDFLLNLHKF